ncbi:MAG: FtsX-like permease family protein [Acetatifactor sp.]|nr:FtsX-like permease family protein [Acetatifactor sp.]
MVVGIKDGAKLAGIMITSFCAVLVCTLFLNYDMDLASIEDIIAAGPARMMYDAQVMTSKVVCCVTGGCLLATTVVMLFFYIRHYIDTHKKELGILKALGYSNMQVAIHFWVFGLSVFLGAGAGYLGASLMMPRFYETQNADGMLPDIVMHFHPLLFLYLVVGPALFFAAAAVLYACRKLKAPALSMIRENLWAEAKTPKHRPKDAERPFLTELKRSTLREKKILVFFMVFAAFCFSAMTQMSFSMKELSSVMMGAMMLLIGIVLACTALFLAVTTVVRGNARTIAMMRVFGYCEKQCSQAILGGYRPAAYVGFAIGTVYQYGLLRIMVDVVFRNIEEVPAYEFDFPMMCLSLAFFSVAYELVLYGYSRRIKKISIKEIMLE